MAKARCEEPRAARGEDRRGADRREREVPIMGADRRIAERRSGRDRRDD